MGKLNTWDYVEKDHGAAIELWPLGISIDFFPFVEFRKEPIRILHYVRPPSQLHEIVSYIYYSYHATTFVMHEIGSIGLRMEKNPAGLE